MKIGLFSKKFRLVIRFSLFFFIAQFLFSNCGPLGQFQSQSQERVSDPGSSDTEGNGNGYVGIRISVPVAAAPNTKFKAFALGGTAPYQFVSMSKDLKLIEASGNEATFEVLSTAAINSQVTVKVTDVEGDEALGNVRVTVFENKVDFTSSMNFYGSGDIFNEKQKVKLDGDEAYIGWPSVTLLEQKNRQVQDGPEYSYERNVRLTGGYISIQKYDAEKKQWVLKQDIKSRDLQEQLKVMTGQEIYFKNFGRYYEVKGNTLVVMASYYTPEDMGGMFLSERNEEVLVLFFNRPGKDENWKLTQVARANQFFPVQGILTFISEINLVSENELVLLHQYVDEYLIFFKKDSLGVWKKSQTLKMPKRSVARYQYMRYDSITVWADQIYLLSRFDFYNAGDLTTSRALVDILSKSDGLWKVTKTLERPSEGYISGFNIRDDKMSWIVKLNSGFENGQFVGFKQKLLVFQNVNGDWLPHSTYEFLANQICTQVAFNNSLEAILGCSSIPYLNDSSLMSQLDKHVFGRVHLIRWVNGAWVKKREFESGLDHIKSNGYASQNGILVPIYADTIDFKNDVLIVGGACNAPVRIINLK